MHQNMHQGVFWAGKCEYSGGSVSKGEVKAGTKHGRGRFLQASARYSDPEANNLFATPGRTTGTYTWADGHWHVYEGESREGKQHGRGEPHQPQADTNRHLLRLRTLRALVSQW